MGKLKLMKQELNLSSEQIQIRDQIALKLQEAQCVGAIWSLNMLQKEIEKEKKKKVLILGKTLEDMIQALKWSLEKKFRTKFGKDIK